jgi:hypothetical protein
VAISRFKTYRDGREACLKSYMGRREYKARTLTMAERQMWLCGLCGLPMSYQDVTFDHEFGRGMGGARRDDRIEIGGRWVNAAVHLLCNSKKGSSAAVYVIEQPR